MPVERPLTLYLNAQEIVTMMTIGDYPEYLALGYLLNQNMLKYDDVVTEVEYDDDLQVVVVRTEHHTNFEPKLKKRTQTSGCAPGHGVRRSAGSGRKRGAAESRIAHLVALPDDACDQHHAVALSGGRCDPWLRAVQARQPVCYTEDVGRQNAVDKIAGWIYRHGVDPARQDSLHHRAASPPRW